MRLPNVIQNGEIYDKQLFVKNSPFSFVYRLDANRTSALYDDYAMK